MTDSLNLSPETPADPGSAARFAALRDAAAAVDGHSGFSDQSLADVTNHTRTLLLVEHTEGSGAEARNYAVGAAVLGGSELEFVVDPAFRGRGYGRRMLDELLALTPPDLLAWSHGDHPAARALAASHRFHAVRTLLQLRLPSLPSLPSPSLPSLTSDDTVLESGNLEPAANSGHGTSPAGAGNITIDTFRVGEDEAEWLEVNARVFADHPEQGKLTLADLQAREAEPWFSADDFLIARDTSTRGGAATAPTPPTGRMIGFHWMKVEPRHPESGEIYAIGVDASYAGKGLGRRLMLAGLARLAERGVTSATLYVEADNAPAVALYRSLGFVDHSVDVQYRRRS